MAPDIETLLRLPAADRLALADILRRSVGHPRDLESLDLPAWQREHWDRLLQRWCGPPGGTPRGQESGPQESRPKKSGPKKRSPTEVGLPGRHFGSG